MFPSRWVSVTSQFVHWLLSMDPAPITHSHGCLQFSRDARPLSLYPLQLLLCTSSHAQPPSLRPLV